MEYKLSFEQIPLILVGVWLIGISNIQYISVSALRWATATLVSIAVIYFATVILSEIAKKIQKKSDILLAKELELLDKSITMELQEKNLDIKQNIYEKRTSLYSKAFLVTTKEFQKSLRGFFITILITGIVVIFDEFEVINLSSMTAAFTFLMISLYLLMKCTYILFRILTHDNLV